MKKFVVGSGEVWVDCRNNKSFRIVDKATKQTVVLVPCDRTNVEDNARGLRIAQVVESALNKICCEGSP